MNCQTEPRNKHNDHNTEGNILKYVLPLFNYSTWTFSTKKSTFGDILKSCKNGKKAAFLNMF